MRRLTKLVIFAVAVCLLGACAKVNAIEIGETAKDFTLADINGNKVSLSEHKGKVIILDFFASWCPPCREEVPDFIKLQKDYAPQGFTMIGVALEKLSEAKKFAENEGINYPVLIDDNNASGIYGPIRSIPTTFVIGRDFTVKRMYIGFRSKDVFENDIKELLSK